MTLLRIWEQDMVSYCKIEGSRDGGRNDTFSNGKYGLNKNNDRKCTETTRTNLF